MLSCMGFESCESGCISYDNGWESEEVEEVEEARPKLKRKKSSRRRRNKRAASYDSLPPHSPSSPRSRSKDFADAHVLWREEAFESALPIYERLASTDGRAAYNASMMRGQGQGCEANKLVALVLLKQGADLGNGRSMFALGSLYAAGRGGVSRDAAAAREWLERCVQGTSDSSENERDLASALLRTLDKERGSALCPPPPSLP